MAPYLLRYRDTALQVLPERDRCSGQRHRYVYLHVSRQQFVQQWETGFTNRIHLMHFVPRESTDVLKTWLGLLRNYACVQPLASCRRNLSDVYGRIHRVLGRWIREYQQDQSAGEGSRQRRTAALRGLRGGPHSTNPYYPGNVRLNRDRKHSPNHCPKRLYIVQLYGLPGA
jgi:hypothetical protein